MEMWEQFKQKRLKKILKEVQSWAPSFEQRPHPAMTMHSVSLLLEPISVIFPPVQLFPVSMMARP